MGLLNRALKRMGVLGLIKTSMKAEDTIVDSTATVSPGRKNSLMGCLPLAVFVGWWIYSLQFQWRAQEEYRFGYLVVVLVAFLVWDRWDGRPRGDTPVATWRASGWLLLGFPLVLVAELYRHALARTPASATALSLGTLCFIRASILQQWGPQTLRHFRFPILFALIAVPLPGIFWNPIVLGLKGLVTLVNVELLNLLGIPAQQQGSVIQLPNCRVGVDEACSGIRSLQSSLMMALFIGDQSLRRAGLRWLLVGVAVPVPSAVCSLVTGAATLTDAELLRMRVTPEPRSRA